MPTESNMTAIAAKLAEFGIGTDDLRDVAWAAKQLGIAAPADAADAFAAWSREERRNSIGPSHGEVMGTGSGQF